MSLSVPEAPDQILNIYLPIIAFTRFQEERLVQIQQYFHHLRLRRAQACLRVLQVSRLHLRVFLQVQAALRALAQVHQALRHLHRVQAFHQVLRHLHRVQAFHQVPAVLLLLRVHQAALRAQVHHHRQVHQVFHLHLQVHLRLRRAQVHQVLARVHQAASYHGQIVRKHPLGLLTGQNGFHKEGICY
jgi:hypothetical protein